MSAGLCGKFAFKNQEIGGLIREIFHRRIYQQLLLSSCLFQENVCQFLVLIDANGILLMTRWCNMSLYIVFTSVCDTKMRIAYCAVHIRFPFITIGDAVKFYFPLFLKFAGVFNFLRVSWSIGTRRVSFTRSHFKNAEPLSKTLLLNKQSD